MPSFYRSAEEHLWTGDREEIEGLGHRHYHYNNHLVLFIINTTSALDKSDIHFNSPHYILAF